MCGRAENSIIVRTSNGNPKLRLSEFQTAAIVGGVGRIVSITGRFLSIPLLMNLVSAEEYGLWLIIGSLIAWLGFSDLGIPSALQNQLVLLRGDKNQSKAKALVSYGFRYLGSIAIITLGVGSALIVTVPWELFFRINVNSGIDFRFALWVSLVAMSIGLPCRIGTAIYYAHGSLVVPAIFEMFVQIVSLLLLLLIACFERSSLTTLSVTTLLCLVLGPVCLSVVACKKFRYNMQSQELDRELKTIVVGKGIFFLVTIIGEIMILQTDAVIIGGVLGAALVPLYMIPSMLFLNFMQLQNVFLKPLWPIITLKRAENQIKALQTEIVRVALLSFLGATVFGFGLIAFGNGFILWWSRGVASLPAVMAWGFAFYTIIASIDNLLATCLNAFGKIELRFLYTLLFGIAKILVAMLVLKYGNVYWLPLAFAVTMATTSVPFAFTLVFLELRSPGKEYK